MARALAPRPAEGRWIGAHNSLGAEWRGARTPSYCAVVWVSRPLTHETEVYEGGIV